MDKELLKHMGEVARSARERLGLTQAEVARRARMSPVVYGRIERGLMMPSVPSLRRVCGALAISADALLGLSSAVVSPSVEVPPPDRSLSPELRRAVSLLQAWPEGKVKLLNKIVKMLDTAEPS